MVNEISLQVQGKDKNAVTLAPLKLSNYKQGQCMHLWCHRELIENIWSGLVAYLKDGGGEAALVEIILTYFFPSLSPHRGTIKTANLGSD